MRFLMLNWRDPKNPKSGGAERVSSAYLGALIERGHEAFWFANDFPGAVREEIIDGITVVRGGGPGVSIWQARQWYRRQKPFDLVIDQHHGIPWYAPWWCGTNSIAYIHEVLGPIWNAFHPWPISTLGRSQERWTHWLYRNVPFWTPSESTRQALHRHGVRRVNVFPNGSDTTPIAALEPKPFSRPLRLVVVCRLAVNKRVDHAIEVAKLLNAAGVETELTIVGTGEFETILKQQAAATGLGEKIIFAGRLNEADKNAALRRAHFLIHTSVREGWGLNVIEANAMGTPAVVYPVDGLVDSTVDQVTGIVAPVETPQALANTLIALAQQPATYDRYRRNAWERSQTFAWKKVLPPACDWLEAQAAQSRRAKPRP